MSGRAFARLSDEHIRFLRFVVVGIFNTAVGYGLFCIALALVPTTFVALCASTIMGVLFNFVSTGSFVFGSRDPRKLARFFGVYAIVFTYNALGLAALERVGVHPRLSGLLLLPGAVLGAYALNRRFVFGAAR